MSDYDLLREYAPHEKPREQRDTEGDSHDDLRVAKAIEHGRPDTLAPSSAAHLQRLAGNAATSALVAQREDDPSLVHQVVGKGGGSTLDDVTRSKMESSFGADFSGVKVHSGPDAAAAAKSVQAQAFTVGNDIVLGEGKSTSDTRTLAHELTHVVQQRSGDVPGTSVGNGIKLSDPGDWAERQAESTADAVMAAPTADHEGHDHSGGEAAGASVQREEAKDEDEAMPSEEEEKVQALALQREEMKDEDEAMESEEEKA